MSRDNRNLPTTAIRPVPGPRPQSEDAYGGAGESNLMEDLHLRSYLRIVTRHKKLIAITTLVAMLLGLTYAFSITPTYTANSRIRISSYEPLLAANSVEGLLQRNSQDNRFLQTQIQEITSLTVADMVLRDEEVRSAIRSKGSSSIFGSLRRLLSFSRRSESSADSNRVVRYSVPIRELRDYLDKISVRPIRKTSLVEIRVSDSDPAIAAKIANLHSEAYMDWVRDVRIQRQSRGLEFLEEQQIELKSKTAQLERQMAQYAEEHSIVALNKDENVVVQKMAQLNELYTKATARRIESEKLFEEAQQSLVSGSVAFDDSALQQMRTKLSTLEAEREQLLAKFTPEYPKIKQLSSQIAGLEQSVKTHVQQVLMGLKVKAEAARAEEASLKDELGRQQSQAFDLSRKEVEYNVLKRELQSTRELLQNVTRQIKETGLSIEGNATNVSFVDYAVAPRSPSAPRKKLILLVSCIVGLFGGLVLAFVMSHLDNSFHTAEDIGEHLMLPHLGTVPAFDGATTEGPPIAALPDGSAGSSAGESTADESGSLELIKTDEEPPIVFIQNPMSLASESYRAIRTSILLSQAGEPPRSLLVTSAQASEGKTTLSVNLAASLAGSGGRVVILDCDLRRPTVSGRFGLEPGLPGVVEILTGHVTPEAVIKPDVVKNVSVLPCGKIPPNPAELLGSPEMARLIEQLEESYDYVLVDSPPILPVTDSVVLSRLVDGVVLVVKSSATPKPVVADAKNRLQSVGSKVLGVVLNGVDMQRDGYGYYYRYYYQSYTSDDNSPKKRRRKNGFAKAS